MGRLSYFFKRLVKMDWKAMWKTAGLLQERTGKTRLWLMATCFAVRSSTTRAILTTRLRRCTASTMPSGQR